MESRQVTGVVLIAGVLGMLAGITAHPHHGPVAPGDDVAWQNLVVATIVVSSYGVLGVGFLRLLRSMTPQLWNDVAGVALAFAGICGALAAIAGHVVVPRLLEHSAAADTGQVQASLIIKNEMILSVTLAQTSFIAWAIGMVLLSVAMFQGGVGWKIVGACGVALGLLIVTALALGRLEFTLHNIGLVALASAIWVVAIAVGMCRNQSFSSVGSN
jgi:hypothetical protein